MQEFGRYVIFVARMFTNRESFRVYFKLFFEECIQIGVKTLFLLIVISLFIGGVMVVQTASNLTNPLVPRYIIGTIVRDMTILEIAPTFTAIVFAGKVGSNIASQLGTMRITKQIDAIEVMGINALSYLVLPKLLAGLIMYPVLVILGGFLEILGGYVTAIYSGQMTGSEYIYGIRAEFIPFNITFALIKSFVFAFLVVSISAFQGFYTKGGALEVGKASTVAVTKSCIAILTADFALAYLLLG